MKGNLLHKSPRRKFVGKLALCWYSRAVFPILCPVLKKSFSTKLIPLCAKISTKLISLHCCEGCRITGGQQIVLSTEHRALSTAQGQRSPITPWLQHKCLCLKMRKKQFLYLADGASQPPVPPQGSILQVT